MRRVFGGALLAAFLAAALTGARTPLVAEASPLPCPPGRYILRSGVPAVIPGGPAVAAVDVGAGGSVAVEGCGMVAGAVRARRGHTRVRALWPRCGGVANVRLVLRVAAPGCADVQATLRGRRMRRVRFDLARSTCGDGAVDVAGDEECDASPGGDGACPGRCGEPGSASACQCAPPPTTTTTTTLPANPSPTNLVAQVVGDDVQLSWASPDPTSGNTEVRLLRRLDVPPAEAQDPQAAVILAGAGNAMTHPLGELLPSTSLDARTYHYAVFGCAPGGGCETTGSRTMLSPTLVQVLRAGGYVLHWRHASATVCADQTQLGTAATTMVPGWWQSCDADCGTATARQLNQDGVNEATTIGEVFYDRGIPVGRVLTSEFCRCFTTAELMSFGPTIEERQDITFYVYDEANRCASSYTLIGEPPPAGSNTGIVGHAGFTCAVLDVLAWGEAAVFKPDGAGGAVLVDRVSWDEWATLP